MTQEIIKLKPKNLKKLERTHPGESTPEIQKTGKTEARQKQNSDNKKHSAI